MRCSLDIFEQDLVELSSITSIQHIVMSAIDFSVSINVSCEVNM